MSDEAMSEAAFCEEYVALLEAIRDALVGIEDDPMSMVRHMAEQAIEGDPEGAAVDMRAYVDERQAIQVIEGPEGEALGKIESMKLELPDEEQPE